MSEWKIGISAWIIQDGNYGDFRCHERAEFALEFYPLTAKRVRCQRSKPIASTQACTRSMLK